MKNVRIFNTLFIAFVLISSCKKHEIVSNFDKSYAAWISFKSNVNNSYNYTAVEYNTASYAATTITVMQGQVVQREYAYYEFVFTSTTADPTRKLVKQWKESGITLNTHSGEGAALLTLDEVYYQAENVWLTAHTPENYVVFEADNNGLISSAGYYPSNCVANCFIGINIVAVSK